MQSDISNVLDYDFDSFYFLLHRKWQFWAHLAFGHLDANQYKKIFYMLFEGVLLSNLFAVLWRSLISDVLCYRISAACCSKVVAVLRYPTVARCLLCPGVRASVVKTHF